MSAIVLLLCESGPLQFSSLIAQAAAQLGVEPDKALEDALARIVEQCESLGLLERVEA